ncbi:MAG: helix-turn-helix domain-containing protein [Saprospiraceae bacterium]
MNSLIKNVKNFEDLLRLKYGEPGTPKRLEFENKALAFYLGAMLKEERHKAKLSKSDLAKRADVKKEFISRVENGKADVPLSIFLKLLNSLNLQLKIIF